TVISGQGLQGRLPLGWSPIAAIDISPAGVTLGQPAALTAPNAVGLPAGTSVTVAPYDASRHDWIVAGTPPVRAGGRWIARVLGARGQVVCVAADDAPSTPAIPAVGDPLGAAADAAVPLDATATGEVVPRSAPPGDQARAVGRVLLRHSAPLSSGTVV